MPDLPSKPPEINEKPGTRPNDGLKQLMHGPKPSVSVYVEDDEAKNFRETLSLSTTSSRSLDREATNYNQRMASSDIQNYPGTEREHFEMDFERHGLQKTTHAESIVHIMKGTFGIGVLTIHEAFMVGGLWTSLCTVFVIGLINYYAMYLLGSTAHEMYRRTRLSKLSYPGLAEMAAATGPWKFFRKWSKPFRYSVDFCIVSCLSGTCCIYQIMIAKTFKLALEGLQIDLTNWLSQDIRMYILCITPILLGICMIRSLKILAPFSMISDILVGICVITTLYFSFQTEDSLANRPAWNSTHGFFSLIGICMYCTCGIAVCLPVENHMKKPKQFYSMITYAMAIVTVLTAATGFFGYWGWGKNCKSPVTIHLPIKIYTAVVQVFLGLMLCITYSVQFYVPFSIIWHYSHNFIRLRSHKSMVAMERIFRVFMVFLVTCIAVTFPELMPFMAFVGHFFLGIVGFVFPAFIDSLITWREDRRQKIRWRTVKNILMIAFGFFLSGTAF